MKKTRSSSPLLNHISVINPNPEGSALGCPLRGLWGFTIRSTGVLELWSIGKNISEPIRVVKMICHHLAEFILLKYIKRANNQGVRLSKTRFIHLGFNNVQHSNTPVLQYSGMSSAVRLRRIYSDLALRTRLSIIE